MIESKVERGKIDCEDCSECVSFVLVVEVHFVPFTWCHFSFTGSRQNVCYTREKHVRHRPEEEKREKNKRRMCVIVDWQFR